MEAARNGNGVDRHLFGLWCAAYEADMAVPALFEDELYTKRYTIIFFEFACVYMIFNVLLTYSGGGGNFVLSTSCLGYTAMVGFVGPMCLDGYATFYSITNDMCVHYSAIDCLFI